MQDGPAASSGSNPKAPGSAGGYLLHRSSGHVIHDNRIIGNRGGAGVMLTGDDGSGNPTATTTLHNKVIRNEFVDNGDGLEPRSRMLLKRDEGGLGGH